MKISNEKFEILELQAFQKNWSITITLMIIVLTETKIT